MKMSDDQILTREWLAEKLEADRLAAEKAEEERRDEQDRENLRAAWKQETGVEPTVAELEQALAEKRRADVADTARRNEAQARRSLMQNF
jgi:hypothetical protein